MYSIHILLLNRCIRGTATLYNFQHLRWRNTNNWLHGIKHLHRSSYPNSTGSSAGGSELRVDFQMVVWICVLFECLFRRWQWLNLWSLCHFFLSILLDQTSTRSIDIFNVTKLLDKLIILNFALAGSVLSRNHGLATFVHDRLEWSLVV